MPISFDNIIIFSAGGVVGSLAGFLLEHRLSRSRGIELIQITDFNKAAAIFRVALVDEIYLLRKNIINGNTFIDTIITDNTYIGHEKAKIIFEPFLADTEMTGFNNDWDKYKNCKTNYYLAQTPPSKHPVFHPVDVESRKDFSIYYLNHIENLLNYAKPK